MEGPWSWVPLGINYGRFSEFKTSWGTGLGKEQEPNGPQVIEAVGTMASWPKEAGLSTIYSFFSACSVCSRLKVPAEGPVCWASATRLLPGCFDIQERKALAFVLGGEHLKLPYLHFTQRFGGNSPKVNQSVIGIEEMDVATCSKNDKVDALLVKSQLHIFSFKVCLNISCLSGFPQAAPPSSAFLLHIISLC